MPVFNGERYIAAALESVLEQTYPDFELVISNNHSSDGTGRILDDFARRDARIRILEPSKHLTQIENTNWSLTHIADGTTYIKVVHADDTIVPTCIERMVEVAEAHPSAGMVGAMRRVGDQEIDLIGVPATAQLVPGRWLVGMQLVGARYTTGPPTASLLRVDALSRLAGPYDSSYVHADDALAYGILMQWDFGYVGEPLSFTRIHGEAETSWSNHLGSWAPEHLRMVLAFGRETLSPREFDVVMHKLEQQYAWFLARSLVKLRLVREQRIRSYHRNALELLGQGYRGASMPLPAELRPFARLLRARAH